ncbi:MAG: RnfABCDGE type electron transport complex subunit A [Thermodesulfobacteriota bacterium]|nr:RnfABCDGE type electron transport complex subunit A [Thermodesulfobacteriota bacterium]
MSDYLLMAVGAILVNNILLAQYLGCCPFVGVSKQMDTAVGMTGGVVFVLTMAGLITWTIDAYLLRYFDLVYLRTIVFILVIASLVQFVETFLRKMIPPLYKGLGIFLPLITTNCAIFGVCIINVRKDFNFMETLVFSITSALGFGLALILMAGLRERMATARIPKILEGTAITMITAGFIALAFFGFVGMA